MEGPQGLRPFGADTTKGQIFLVAIIILFHVVGLAGLCTTAVQPLFRQLVPWHLLLMLMVIITSHKPTKGRFLIFGAVIFIFAFIAEWTGVHTHRLFGDYTYGDTLGMKLDEVPVIIGVNWLLLVYAAGVLMRRSRVRNVLMRILCGAIILVLLDVLVEHTAGRLDYWHWAGNTVPFTNYACWFIVSALLLFVFELFEFKKQSIVAPVFLAVQFVFFLALWIL